MTDALVLNRKARLAGFYGLLSLALLSALGTAKLSFAPPILKTAQTEAAIAASLAKGESYSAPAEVGWAKALSLALAGVSLVSGFSALHLSSPRPKTLTTLLLDDIANPATPTTLSSLSDQQHTHQGEIITDKLTELFDESPWLEDVIDIEGSLMDLLIIVGMPGKGKSCLASAIGLLRRVMHVCPVYIFDADADKNVRTQTWVMGQVAGMTTEHSGAAAGDYGHLAYSEQHARMQQAVLAELNSGQEPAVTVIYDEEQRLSQNGFSSKDIQQHYEDYTAYRKRGDKVIHLWHAATRSGSGLDKLPKDSALLTELQREKRKDSQLCNEVMIALPAELSHRQKQALTREYVQGEFVSQGMIADIGYHDFDSHNPHAHIMLTMRRVNEQAFGKKECQWNRRDAVREYRTDWADYANRALERAGYEARIDHRSLKAQGVAREPQLHLGAQVLEMEAKGIQTRVGDESRRISKVNRDIARRQVQREKLRADIEREQSLEPRFAQPVVSAVEDFPVRSMSKASAESSNALGLSQNPQEADGQGEPIQIIGVAESILKGIDPELLKYVRARLDEAKTPAPSVEKKQAQTRHQEQPNQRQKKRAKEREQGMEM